MTSPLTIYRASAGAGKTFRLVVEYIKLLMLRPDEYKYILAVTFTKKATEEMKIRILSQLYGLREGLSSSDGYMKCITSEMHISEHEVSKSAGEALKMILNDYSHFRIETIDSFFQSVLRNMTRELDISTNMRVEINGKQVKDKAIDAMIDNLEPDDDLFRRIEDFAKSNLNEGKSWNIIEGLKSFGSNIFSNFYQSHAKEYKERLSEDKDLFKNFRDKLYAIKTSAEQEILKAAEDLKRTINDAGYHDLGVFNKSNGSGLGKMYEKIAAGDFITIPATVLKYAESDEAWFKKADANERNLGVVRTTLRPALRRYLKIHEQLSRIPKSCIVILRNLNNIELLGAIEEAVNASNIQANRFMLSSTNQLLAEMIDDADSPFIYEKIGTQIKHLMIDEFQDTSTLQWKNFKTLLLESMSYYDPQLARGTVGSMIVGDVKQSIYRWRDGDWRLLNDIKQEFANESDTEIKNLDTNFRSEANIINFNNRFFVECQQILGIGSAYDDVAQKVKPGRDEKGEVEFYMLEDKTAYDTRHMMICEKVKQLIDSGVKAKDIAILGRNGDILKELSKTFMDNFPEIKVVSKESFQINASTAVRVIIYALRFTLNPKDKICLATLEKLSGIQAEKCEQILDGISKTQPLLNIVEDIFKGFRLSEMPNDSSFISAFFDHLNDFASQNTSTIRNFLKYWDEVICEKAIETESTDGVQMMTIHKSKGLEFDNVIIADGAWPTGAHRNNIWIETHKKPFDDVPFTYVSANSSLEGTIFEDNLKEEISQNTVDNLNLLYVAFTRAGKNLYFYGQKGATSTMSETVEKVLEKLDLDDNHFGTFAGHEEKKKDENSGNVFDMPVSSTLVPLSIHQQQGEFVQSNRSKQFIASSSTTAEGETEKGNSYISLGLLLHYVLSQIETLADVDTVLQKLECEGIIPEKRFSNLIRERIFNSKYATQWFAPEWTVYNECSIVTAEGTKRPDRVITNGEETIVIDFKFGNPNPEYERQVLDYKALLEDIGFKNVTAYLWFVYTDEIQLCF